MLSIVRKSELFLICPLTIICLLLSGCKVQASIAFSRRLPSSTDMSIPAISSSAGISAYTENVVLLFWPAAQIEQQEIYFIILAINNRAVIRKCLLVIV